jgi:hypothetical protein
MKWLVILSFSTFAYAQQNFQWNEPTFTWDNNSFHYVECKERPVSEPPFHVSDAYQQGEKNYENFRSKDNYRQKSAHIPRRSIVKIPEESKEFAESPDYYIPVEVVGVPSEFADEKLKGSKRFGQFSSKYSRLDRAKVGQKGFLYSKSIKKADDYTYIVEEDSPLMEIPGLEEIGTVALKIRRDFEGNYIMKECCRMAGWVKQEDRCTSTYEFQIIRSDGSHVKDVSIDITQCNALTGLVPFENKDISNLMNFLDVASGDAKLKFSLDKMEVMDTRGLVKVPIDYETHEGPFGSYHYNSDDKVASDAYAKPMAGCTLLKVMEEHQKRCKDPGCQLQFGNIYHPDSWGVHSDHDGDCVDIRPLKKKDTKTSTNIWRSDYDAAKTKKLLELLKEAGGKPIFFNDNKLRKELGGVSYKSGHHNHIHVCFREDNEQVQETCTKGFK